MSKKELEVNMQRLEHAIEETRQRLEMLEVSYDAIRKSLPIKAETVAYDGYGYPIVKCPTCGRLNGIYSECKCGQHFASNND